MKASNTNTAKTQVMNIIIDLTLGQVNYLKQGIISQIGSANRIILDTSDSQLKKLLLHKVYDLKKTMDALHSAERQILTAGS